ncbi:lysozyme inhibitor LprI family protein [Aquisediminimonas sediminicola]|uniref:lysozyme inhibitor LprI family protein n=1 Tax=Alteraquisediminimonas sediminicola TaxID=2676787 RepID=UPI001C8D2B27|nr:lysozyme inhibitor LprI family protein [Aquisediminimonas sediminicola]
MTHFRKSLLLTLALGLSLAPALPATAQYDVHAEDYARFERELAQADARLNQVWKTYYPQLRAADGYKADALLAEQRAWNAFKDKACSIYPGAGGFWGEANAFACKLELFEQRIKYLEDLETVLNP